MTSYQHEEANALLNQQEQARTSTPSSTTSRSKKNSSSHNSGRRKRMGLAILTLTAVVVVVVVVGVLMMISVSNMSSVFPYGHMERIPIEMEGWPLRHKSGDEESDHETLQDGCEATVIIMRHCEKGDLRKHCDYIGLERSVYLASLFGNGNERWPAPSYIFAEGPGGRHSVTKRNYREIETVGPLSRKTGVKVDASYDTLTRGDLVKHVATLLKSGDLCGKLVVIVWKHSGIARLAHKLGCGHEEGCPMDYKGKDYDRIWQLRFVYGSELYTEDVHFRHGRGHLNTWRVFGNVQPEDFDPLEFSKKRGDYPKGGRFGESNWVVDADILDEETVTNGRDNWEEVKPSFVLDN